MIPAIKERINMERIIRTFNIMHNAGLLEM